MTPLTQKKFNKMIKPIRNDKDYKKALARMNDIFDSKPGTKEGDELEILGILIEKYEDENYPIEAPDPIEALKFRMEQMGYKQKDVAKILGYKGRVSEILNRKRKLTIDMVRKLHNKMQIPLESLISEPKKNYSPKSKKFTLAEPKTTYKKSRKKSS
jgi:HTH-type transcriptional regulator / antitoxin HigA